MFSLRAKLEVNCIKSLFRLSINLSHKVNHLSETNYERLY